MESVSDLLFVAPWIPPSEEEIPGYIPRYLNWVMIKFAMIYMYCLCPEYLCQLTAEPNDLAGNVSQII